ncbi:MAG: acyl-CoA thioesterase [Myxococcales bacterium]|nr:acyl-CoA thioesterase [Myxococcales bacterium]
MFEHTIDVTWGECDLAGLVYFPRMLDWCHRALEALWGGLEGGYARFTGPRRLGIPTVRIAGDFQRPVRYGERVIVRVGVARIGTKSVTFRHDVTNAEGALCARFEHVIAVCELDGPRAIEVPDDVRALLAPHAIDASDGATR